MANSQWTKEWVQEAEFLSVLVLVIMICFISLDDSSDQEGIHELPEPGSLGIDKEGFRHSLIRTLVFFWDDGFLSTIMASTAT